MKRIYFIVLGLLLLFSELDAQSITEYLPNYQINLFSYEYPIFSQAVFSGINKYEGKLNYRVNISKESNGLFCMIAFDNKQIVQVIKYYISEMSLKALEEIDGAGNVSKNSLEQISLIKSVANKLDYTLEHPILKSIHILGKIVKSNDLYYITTDQVEAIQLVGKKTNFLETYEGKSVLITGVVNEDKTIELADFSEQKKNTLEVCMMSLCPYGQQAVLALLNHFEMDNSKQNPQLEIHYILYPTKAGFKTMHGEEELKEDLIQILIRDNYSRFFQPYLKKRFENKNLSWQDVAISVGLKRNDINDIEREIVESRNNIIEKEYEYVANKNQVFDGSPTYLWESQPIKDIRKIKGFEDFNLTEGKCDSK